jgi:hypothetical protein
VDVVYNKYFVVHSICSDGKGTSILSYIFFRHKPLFLPLASFAVGMWRSCLLLIGGGCPGSRRPQRIEYPLPRDPPRKPPGIRQWHGQKMSLAAQSLSDSSESEPSTHLFNRDHSLPPIATMELPMVPHGVKTPGAQYG